MSVISVVRTDSYDQETVYRAICRHFDALRVPEDLHEGIKVLLKPNLISAHKPEHAATTHPSMLLAVVRYLREHGVGNIVVADSPGGMFTPAALKTVYSVCGYKELGELLNYDVQWQTVRCPEGFENRSFSQINPVVEADYIINMAKLKTHTMTTLSSGIKNLFGTIPGLQKPEMHYKNQEQDSFARMLLEIGQIVKPALTVIDAVDSMEGNGPNAGIPRHDGVTFASRDMYTQDKYVAELAGITKVPMLEEAEKKGLISEIQLVGDTDYAFSRPFLMPDSQKLDFTSFVPKFMEKPVRRVMGSVLKPMPKADKNICIGCGRCAESCPPQIIKMVDKKAVFTKKGCISCFCCQEMCPVHAISITRKVKF